MFTPPLRVLTPATSKGFAAIEFARDILDITLFPWQEWLLIHALELNEDETYRFRTVLLLVARQNGKSTLMLVLALWRMYADGAPLVIGTAQNLDIAEELWTAAYELAESIPELEELIDHVDKTNGKKALRLTTGERYKVAAASRRGGRGLSGDMVLMDELREHQSWDAWGAVTKTTMARRMAQVWAASNAGDSASVVLRYLRSLAHEALGFPDGKIGFESRSSAPDGVDDDPADDTIGLFEYSARPDRTVWDRDGWAEANPSMGYSISEKAIASAIRTDPEWVANPEVLCRWVTTTGTGPFPEQSWAKTTTGPVVRDTGRPATYCVDVSHDRTMAHIAIAFWDVEGRRRVEIAASRAGTDWVIPWLMSPDRKIRPEHLTLQWNGAPVSSLVTDLEQVTDAPWELTPWRGPDLARASGAMYDAMRSAVAENKVDRHVVLTHGPQPVLDVAATSAVVKPLGDGWVIDRKNSPQDAAPLVAALGANWLLNTNPTNVRSAYEEEGELVL